MRSKFFLIIDYRLSSDVTLLGCGRLCGKHDCKLFHSSSVHKICEIFAEAYYAVSLSPDPDWDVGYTPAGKRFPNRRSGEGGGVCVCVCGGGYFVRFLSWYVVSIFVAVFSFWFFKYLFTDNYAKVGN